MAVQLLFIWLALPTNKMRAAFTVSFLANVFLDLISLAILPDRVAIHFGLGGSPDGWVSASTSTLMMIGIHTLAFGSLYFTSRLVVRVPVKWISLPNRDYWLSPERRARTVEMIGHSLWRFGTALFVFLFFTGLLTLRANLSDPVRLDETALLTALALFLGYVLYWTIALIRAFRVPNTR